MTDHTPSGLPQPQTVAEVARLMRWIDGYAFDYVSEGKLGTSRTLVEMELSEDVALASISTRKRSGRLVACSAARVAQAMTSTG